MDFQWWILVPLAAVIGWVVVSTTGMRKRRSPTDERLAAALSESAQTNRLLAERIDQLDKRLASVEKTLTDIP